MRTKALYLLVVLTMLFGAAGTSFAAPSAAPDAPVPFTILHTNDFHGQLEWKSGGSSSNPGMARVAKVVNDVRAAVGAGNVLLVDAGDEMQGSLLSNAQKGVPTIATYNAMGYNAATFGNHEFDWGQETLIARVGEASYPYVTANIVVNDTGNCSTAGWTTPDFAQPYAITTANGVRVAFIGVTTTEVPTITVATATEGLCFKDPAESILHYYNAMKGEADVIVILSHLGFNDGGYGYGIPVYGDKTLAQKLIDAGKPVPLIIGGHSHTDLKPLTGTPLPSPLPPDYAVVGGKTSVVQAYYNGRRLGRADLTFDPGNGNVTVSWQGNIINSSMEPDPTIDALIQSYANDPDYLELVNTPIGYTQVDLPRKGGTVDNMMATFIDDAIYNYLNTDTEPKNDIDLFFNNAGGIRTDWCAKEDPANPGTYIWSSTSSDCHGGLYSHAPMLLNYGNMYTILPFGNATVVGNMTGAAILQVLNQAPLVSNGVIQPAGLKYKYFGYKDANPGPQPYAWGAFDYCVVNKATKACEPLEMDKTYRVGTNEFLAPAGGDGYGGFKYMTDVSYWGDMLNAVDAWVTANYTLANPYKGPNGDGTLDGRIIRDGTDSGGSIVPITLLHHNDSHGNLAKGQYLGYTQLASLIKQERLHNPNRTLLFNAGDQIQGDSMMYYFKSAPLGYAADGTPLDPALQTHPMMAVMNAMNYDAMTLGNHEFNFGGQIFTSVLKQANFPVMQANVADDGQYGLAQVPVKPYVEKAVGPEGIKVAILGIGNHRVPNYELPSNIPGLTFSDPLVKAQELSDQLRPTNDVVVALTHIGFTEDPKSIEVDKNVDTNMAKTVSGLDAIIGSHSHTTPAAGFGEYKFLPTIVGGPDNTPVIINQAYRYNNFLGEVVVGVRAKAGGGYEVVSRAGRYIAVVLADTKEDPAIKAIVDPYVEALKSYNDKVVGQTTVPIDALQAFTQETNAANLQADASVYELNKHGITPDFHLSGAMTNRKVADAATPASPVTLKVSDMFSLMPYENSLVMLSMNGPQLKAVLERGYRNYYYYKYTQDPWGGYSHYTTCMLDINSVGHIYYKDTAPALPDGNNVVGLMIGDKLVDFNDANTYYKVSTVNYLAAGSCNFNDGGKSLWPLDQIINDTQYYVRDAVIDYVTAKGIVSPAIEGRLVFDGSLPATTLGKTVNRAQAYAGSILMYELKVQNLTDQPQSFTVNDPIPANTEVVRRINYDPATNSIVWSGVLDPWGFKTFYVYVRVKSGTPGGTMITNTAARQGTPFGFNASATTTVKTLPPYRGHRADVDVNEMVIRGN